MVLLEEIGAQRRHVDVNGALGGASLASEATVHGVVDFVGKIGWIGCAATKDLDAGLTPFGSEASAATTHQSQPLAQDARPTLGRMNAIARHFRRRAHDRVGVPVEALSVAVAVHGGRILLPRLRFDLPVEGATLHGVHRHQAILTASGRGELARIELIVRIERRLDRPHLTIELGSEERRRVLAAVAAAMLAPQDATVLLDEGCYGVADGPQRALVFFILQIERRPDVQAPHVDMAKHAVTQAVAVQDGAKLANVVGEVLRRHDRVLHERHRSAIAWCVAQKADALLAQGPERLDVGRLGHELVADQSAWLADLALQSRSHARHLLVQHRLIVRLELHQVDGAQLRLTRPPEHMGDRAPDHVLLRQSHDRVVDGLDGAGIGFDEPAGRAQRVVEGAIADGKELLPAHDRRQPQARLGDDAERPFRAADDPPEVETALGDDVGEVVPRQETLELRQLAGEPVAAPLEDRRDLAVNATGRVRARSLSLELRRAEGFRLDHLSAEDDTAHSLDVLAGLAIDARTLAASIGRDHAAQRGSTAG